jgi:hypothetical protein
MVTKELISWLGHFLGTLGGNSTRALFVHITSGFKQNKIYGKSKFEQRGTKLMHYSKEHTLTCSWKQHLLRFQHHFQQGLEAENLHDHRYQQNSC